jgi:outer membrane lipoprotein-sorting protein
MKKAITTIILMMVILTSATAMDAISIVRRLDNNEVYDSIKYEGEMIIHLSGKKIVKTFYAYGSENNDMFMEFTNPDDEGTKYLKLDGNLYVYTEELEEVMPITGHMLKESMMGSDMSYEDTVENETLESQYNAKIVDEVVYDGKECWVLDLTAKRKTVSYSRQKIWVDKKHFNALKTEQFALSGARIKEVTMERMQQIGSRYFPTKITIRDLHRKDSKTVFDMSQVELDVEIPRSVFSLRNLER